MPRRLPQLSALRAFEAAARHVSFTRAAEELSVTQGAVSHQVKALESELGIKFFNRERQRLSITEAGREYLAVVRDALDRIANGTERLVQRQSSGFARFRRQVVSSPARSICRGPSRDRPSGIGHHASCRLRTRGRRHCGPSRRWSLARITRDALVLRTFVRCVQPCACIETRSTR
jgi:DNA-binding MarR family transcriptional regulator